MGQGKKLFITGLFVLAGFAGNTQEQFYKIVKEYFRVDPFAGSFSAFVNAVNTDPALTDKQIVEKTDTSFYEIKGIYQQFNPFYFAPKRVEMELSEEKIPLQIPQTGRDFDTVVAYQIRGYFDSTEKNMQYVKRQFETIHKALKKDLRDYKTNSLKNVARIKDGVANNYFWETYLLSPVTVSWFLSGDKELVLMLVLRLKYIKNRATPAGSVYNYLQ